MKATIKFNGKEYDAELTEKKVESKRWKPETNENYWYVSYGDVFCNIWENDSTGNFRYSQRNVFKTREEAEKHLQYLKSLAILRDDAGDWEPDLTNYNQEKYYVFFSYSSNCLEVDFLKVAADMNIYFETEEAAQKSIDDHKEHWLRVLGVNDD